MNAEKKKALHLHGHTDQTKATHDSSNTICPKDTLTRKQNIMGDDVRIDKWLWAVRLYKSRSEAAEACKTGKVTLNGAKCKPSKEIQPGDVITVRKVPTMTYTWRVVDIVGNRQPAKNVPLYAQNITPQSELDKLEVPHETIFIMRDRGAGRPTKKERRDMEEMMGNIFYDDGSDDEF